MQKTRDRSRLLALTKKGNSRMTRIMATAKKTRGRTPLPAEVRRSEVVQTRGTKAERVRWEETAYRRRTSISEMVRAFLNREAKKQLGEEPTLNESPTPSNESPKPSPRKRAPAKGAKRPTK